MPGPDILFNIYQVKDNNYCGPCYDTIRKRHLDKGMKWEGTILWQEDNSDLQKFN